MCATGRSGTLCGSCSEGFSLSFFSNECVLKEGTSCNVGVYMTYITIISVLYTVIFTFLPLVVEMVKKKFEERKLHTLDDQNELEEVVSSLVQVRTSIGNTAEDLNNKEPLPVTAFVTLVCFFFQVASLVHVDVQSRNISKMDDVSYEDPSNTFQTPLYDFFNFQLVIYRNVCPMDDLTLPIKESINIAIKMC